MKGPSFKRMALKLAVSDSAGNHITSDGKAKKIG